MKKFLFILLIIAAFVFAAAYFWYGSGQKLTEVKINNKSVYVEVADTEILRSKGLGDRDSLGQDRGMLFVFATPARYGFWMKDMKFAIDIIWINNDRVVDFIENVPPPPSRFTKDSELVVYQPKADANYALEVSAGWSKQNNFKIGDRVEIKR